MVIYGGLFYWRTRSFSNREKRLPITVLQVFIDITTKVLYSHSISMSRVIQDPLIGIQMDLEIDVLSDSLW